MKEYLLWKFANGGWTNMYHANTNATHKEIHPLKGHITSKSHDTFVFSMNDDPYFALMQRNIHAFGEKLTM